MRKKQNQDGIVMLRKEIEAYIVITAPKHIMINNSIISRFFDIRRDCTLRNGIWSNPLIAIHTPLAHSSTICLIPHIRDLFTQMYVLSNCDHYHNLFAFLSDDSKLDCSVSSLTTILSRHLQNTKTLLIIHEPCVLENLCCRQSSGQFEQIIHMGRTLGITIIMELRNITRITPLISQNCDVFITVNRACLLSRDQTVLRDLFFPEFETNQALMQEIENDYNCVGTGLVRVLGKEAILLYNEPVKLI
jgi:hypothetical protein